MHRAIKVGCFKRSLFLVAVMMGAVVVISCKSKPADASKSADTNESASTPAVMGDVKTNNTGDPKADAIATAVRDRIASNPNIKSKTPRWRDYTPTINVTVNNGIVELRGKVATDEETVAAGNTALGVGGVRGVANYLVAVGGEKMSSERAQPHPRSEIDPAITAVLQNILADPKVTGKIHVCYEAAGDSIRLAGRVADDEERFQISTDATYVTDIGVTTEVAVTNSAEDDLDLSDVPVPAWSESADKPNVPLCSGMTIVTAIASDVDYESIKTIESVNSKEIRVKYTSEVGPPWWTDPRPEAKYLMTTHRTVLTSAMESGHTYDQIYVTSEHNSETVPDATAIGTSAAVLRELKTKGEADIKVCGDARDVQIMGTDGKLKPGPPGGCDSFDSLTIKRVDTEPAHLRVLVNGTPMDLPAIQAQSVRKKEEFFFLNDERNPLTLAFRFGIREMSALSPDTRRACEEAKTRPGLRMTGPISCDLPHGGDANKLRVVKISTDECTKPASASGVAASASAMAMEKALAETGKVDVYNLYFTFNSDVIREESEPTLKEIASVMRKHLDWKLRVAGHTDGIGNDEKNLDLSKRRAAAVKDALVRRYAIPANRLTTTGFGKSQPKDTNETLEGRANNRRVELSKI
jgi:outer membrane protein OmpA-like peptidoglycan-associated protein/osmotically-inducible protein OsmY